jgi:hypothetical protein
LKACRQPLSSVRWHRIDGPDGLKLAGHMEDGQRSWELFNYLFAPTELHRSDRPIAGRAGQTELFLNPAVDGLGVVVHRVAFEARRAVDFEDQQITVGLPADVHRAEVKMKRLTGRSGQFAHRGG